MVQSHEEMLAAFVLGQRLYERFAKKTNSLIAEIIEASPIGVHSIGFRVKTKESLREKIARPGKDYSKLEDITDLVGIRIITHFAEDVDRIAELIDREFDVQPQSIDKRRSMAVNSFGYSSLHRVCRLSNTRLHFPEYSSFQGLTCEIQIRSILQHTWAEIQHDLGYKRHGGVPEPIQRRFFILAALLESADTEFSRIKSEMSAYEQKSKIEVQTAPQKVGIDAITLQQFAERSLELRNAEKEIANKLGANLYPVPPHDAGEVFGIWATYIQGSGLMNMDQLEKEYVSNRNDIIKFATGQLEGTHFHEGISLLIVSLLRISRIGSMDEVKKKLEDMEIHARSRETHLLRISRFLGLSKPAS
ncbi:GTP pyrophosphokinase family protein [Corallococcus exercitus]|uniref:GTP pyrophosphokinase n=1 Tax=Corallococcus exercitus TaxID=2316736 RepID=UPI0035D4415D